MLALGTSEKAIGSNDLELDKKRLDCLAIGKLTLYSLAYRLR